MTGFSDRVHDLLRPSAFPHPARDLRLIETHISWVILAGEFAYKIRKPVNFGFLDFSSHEQRREDCDAEVKFNRRLCPDLYLGVVDVVQRDDRLLYMAGPCRAIEPAVKMRRLPEQGMLPALLERRARAITSPTSTGRSGRAARTDGGASCMCCSSTAMGVSATNGRSPGEADECLMQRIAKTLTAFHSTAATGEGADEYGALDTIRANWTENFAQAQDAESVDAHKRAAIQSYVNHFLVENVRLLEHRVASGRFETNMATSRLQACSTPRRLYLFDCIEFNRRFRCADVAAEVAFLAMDLEHLGRTDLATAFVDAYVRCSGDTELLSLLDFYKCYRAFVPGKVRAFRPAEGQLDRVATETIAAEASAYFELAYAYACPPKQPLLIITMGLPASGKTTLARALAGRLGFVHLSSDGVRKRLAGVRPTTHLRDGFETGLSTRAMTQRTYSALRRQAARWLRRGRSVILDATYGLVAERAAVRRLGRRTGAQTCFIVCNAEESVLRARLAARVSDATSTSDPRPELWPALRTAYVPPTELPDAICVDTGHGVADLVERILAEILQLRGRTQQRAA